MNPTKKTRGRTIPALLVAVVCMLGAFVLGQNLSIEKAHAQSNPATGQKLASSTTSISAGTPAVIITGTTGYKIVVTGMKLASITTGGVVTFYDGAATTTALANAYVPASTSVNNNVDFFSSFIGNTWPTQAGTSSASAPNVSIGTSGASLCAQLNGCVLCYNITYYLQ